MKNMLLVMTLVLLFSGCASFTISKESFVNQLKENQVVERKYTTASAGTGFDANGIEKIKCIDKNGKEVWLYAGKDVSFQITQHPGDKVTLYFDTVYLANDTIFGLKSRLVGGKRKIPVNAVEKIAINAEMAKTEPVN